MSVNKHGPNEFQKNMREQLERRILAVIDDIDKGFKRVMQMYSLAFYIGLGMIVLSVLGGLYFKKDLFPILFGGVGLADVVAFFVFKPVEDLQRSRGNLAQLVSAFLTWYNDTHNWNQMLERELLKEECRVEVFREVSKRSMINTITIMCAIEMFVASKQARNGEDKLKSVIDDLEKKIESIN